jgi:hypothetical protein
MHGRILYVQGFVGHNTCHHQLFVEHNSNKII